MKLLAAIVSFVAVAAAVPTFSSSPLKGYPIGLGSCLNDNQARFLAEVFRQILSLKDRKAAAGLAAQLGAQSYTDYSDSINILAGYPIGAPATSGVQAFVAGVYANTPVDVQTLDVFHDCNVVSWRWRITNYGTGQFPIKGISDFTVNVKTGQVLVNNIEFNSIAWGVNAGGVFTPPPADK